MELHESPSPNTPFVSKTNVPQLGLLQNKKKLLVMAAGAVLVAAVAVGTILTFNRHDKTTDAVVAISEKVGHVTIGADGLVPKSITVKKGQEITWTNNDAIPHHLTADQTMLPSFDTAEPLQQGDTYTYIFDKSGTFHYYDAADPTRLVGTITVQ